MNVQSQSARFCGTPLPKILNYTSQIIFLAILPLKNPQLREQSRVTQESANHDARSLSHPVHYIAPFAYMTPVCTHVS